MLSRRTTVGLLFGAALTSFTPVWAQTRRTWNQSDQQNFSRATLDFLERSVAGTREVDCADLAIIGLIEFANEQKLPIRLYDYGGARRTRRWFNFYPDVPGSNDPSAYENRVLPELGAVNLLDSNTVTIQPKFLRCGDLLVNEYPDLDPATAGYTGHTRIVVASKYDPQEQDWHIDWIQANGSSGEGSIPQRKSGFLKSIAPDVVVHTRRWNFANFNLRSTSR
jgi:hypothetical protein